MRKKDLQSRTHVVVTDVQIPFARLFVAVTKVMLVLVPVAVVLSTLVYLLWVWTFALLGLNWAD